MNACPHCGGTNGWEYKYSARLRASGGWENDEIYDTELLRHSDYTKRRCVDCGKVVNPEPASD